VGHVKHDLDRPGALYIGWAHTLADGRALVASKYGNRYYVAW
jgi:hypothetical protein